MLCNIIPVIILWNYASMIGQGLFSLYIKICFYGNNFICNNNNCKKKLHETFAQYKNWNSPMNYCYHENFQQVNHGSQIWLHLQGFFAMFH